MKKFILVLIIICLGHSFIYSQDIDSNLITNKKLETHLALSFGVMLPQSVGNPISPIFGTSIIPTINNEMEIPVDLSLYYLKVHDKNKWIPRISVSLKFNAVELNKFLFFLQGGLGIMFWETPLNFNLSAGVLIGKIYFEVKTLIWRESGEGSSIFLSSPISFNLGILI